MEYVVDLAGVTVKPLTDSNGVPAIQSLWGLPVHESIVRCRDCEQTCEYGGGIECMGPLVQTWDFFNDRPLHNPVSPDGYCAWGKRKKGEQNG